MSRRVLALFGLCATAALAGCGGNAVLVGRTANGGVFGLDGEHAEAMADARRQMSEACGGAYTIVGERNALTGVFRGRALMEYQVEFVCGDVPAPPSSATPVPPAPR
jgi:hypothetical protein